MPIVTRTLKYIRPQADGTVRVQEVLTTSKGHKIYHSYTAVSEVQAIIDMNDRDMTTQLEDFEEQEAVVFIKNGGDPAVFVKADLTNTEFNRRLAKRFAKAKFDQDPDFLRNMASSIASRTVTQIATWLSITEVKAQVILDRAIHIRDTIDVALVTDETRVQDGIG